MAWKSKKEELSPEEALELAKKERAPYWFTTEPIITASRTGNRFSIQPIDSEFSKKNWLIVFIDLTEYSSQTLLLFAEEWNTRFKENQLLLLIVVYPRYYFLTERGNIENLLERFIDVVPIVIDVDRSISAAFGASKLPKVVLFSEGKIFFEHSGDDRKKIVEPKIHEFLRRNDIGLPLLRFFEPKEPQLKNTGKLEFGKNKGCELLSKRKPILTYGTVVIDGKWQQDAERVIISDPTTMLTFMNPSGALSIVAVPLKESREASQIIVEVNGLSVPESYAGKHLSFDETRTSIVLFREPGIFQIMVGLPKEEREVTLKFPNVDKVPLGLYCLSFGE